MSCFQLVGSKQFVLLNLLKMIAVNKEVENTVKQTVHELSVADRWRAAVADGARDSRLAEEDALQSSQPSNSIPTAFRLSSTLHPSII